MNEEKLKIFLKNISETLEGLRYDIDRLIEHTEIDVEEDITDDYDEVEDIFDDDNKAICEDSEDESSDEEASEEPVEEEKKTE